MMSAFRIDVDRAGGVTVVSPSGRIDSGRIGHLEAVLKEEIEKGRNRLVINFRETLFISSSALRVLLVTHRAVSRTGVLLVAGFLPHIGDMVRTAGFDTLLEVRVDVASAVAEARAGAGPGPVVDGGSGPEGLHEASSGVALWHGVVLGAGTLVAVWLVGWDVALWLGVAATVADVLWCYWREARESQGRGRGK